MTSIKPSVILSNAKEHAADKSVVLDIKARSHGGELFNIEMQALEQSNIRRDGVLCIGRGGDAHHN